MLKFCAVFVSTRFNTLTLCHEVLTKVFLETTLNSAIEQPQMMLRQVLQKLTPLGVAVSEQAQRHFAASAVAAQKAATMDPIQQLFVDKIREYRTKSSGGKLVDATAKTEATLKDMLGGLERSYQAAGVDMTKFPTFDFAEPELQWPGLSEEQATKMYEAVQTSDAADADVAAEEEEKFDPFEGLPRL